MFKPFKNLHRYLSMVNINGVKLNADTQEPWYVSLISVYISPIYGSFNLILPELLNSCFNHTSCKRPYLS